MISRSAGKAEGLIWHHVILVNLRIEGHQGQSWYAFNAFNAFIQNQKVNRNHGLLKDLIARAEAREHIKSNYAEQVKEAQANGAAAVKKGQKLKMKELKENRQRELERQRKEAAEEM